MEETRSARRTIKGRQIPHLVASLRYVFAFLLQWSHLVNRDSLWNTSLGVEFSCRHANVPPRYFIMPAKFQTVSLTCSSFVLRLTESTAVWSRDAWTEPSSVNVSFMRYSGSTCAHLDSLWFITTSPSIWSNTAVLVLRPDHRRLAVFLRHFQESLSISTSLWMLYHLIWFNILQCVPRKQGSFGDDFIEVNWLSLLGQMGVIPV